MAKFYHKDTNEFAPKYGDIDWRALLIGQLAAEGDELGGSIWFDSGDGLDQECNQENTQLILNRVSDDMDVLLEKDPRDGINYSFWRNQIGSETFDRLSKALQDLGCTALLYTVYPREEVVNAWLEQTQGDEIPDFLPDDFS